VPKPDPRLCIPLAVAILLAARVDASDLKRVEGLFRTRPETVAQVLSKAEGSSCDSFCVARDLDALDRLGVFADARAERRGDTMVYVVRELPWILPVPNGRVSDEDGVSLGAGVKTPNLLGRAIAGEFLFLLGRSQEFQVSLTGDRFADHPVGFDLFAARTDRRDEFRRFFETSHTARLRLEAPTDAPWRIEGSIQSLDLALDRDKSLSGDGRDLLISGTGGVVVDTRDRRSLVRRGVRGELSMERVGGDADGWMLLQDLRVWHPLSERFTLHASWLSETQWGRLGAWRTFVLGGGNTVRGLPAGTLQGRSERIATGELRWLAFPVRPVRLLGQDLYWGSELVGGCDAGEVPGHPDVVGPFLSWDMSVPFVERMRLSSGFDPREGWKASFALGLFEKSAAQRFRVR